MGSEKKLKAIEFFSGIGGMHFALEDARVDATVIAAYDINVIANSVYIHNFPSLKPQCLGLDYIQASILDRLSADIWLLSPPCQPYTRGGRQQDDKDPRAAAFLHLINTIDSMQSPPSFIFLENVLNFEVSRSRDKFCAALLRRGYHYEEYLISPLDPYVAIPNDRLRYYLGAVRNSPHHPLSANHLHGDPDIVSINPSLKNAITFKQGVNVSAVDLQNEKSTIKNEIDDREDFESAESRPPQRIINHLGDVLSSKYHISDNPPTMREFLSQFLELSAEASGGSVEYMMVPEKYIREYHNYRHDVCSPYDRRSTTFTKAYGSKYIIGTGSFYQTKNFDLTDPQIGEYDKSNKDILLSLGLRFFTPAEIARLHYLPDHFSFPPEISLIQQYRLLGNSLNVRVVSRLLERLFSSTMGTDNVTEPKYLV